MTIYNKNATEATLRVSMENEKKVDDIKVDPTTESKTEDTSSTEVKESQSQDPVQTELERVKKPKTEQEKAVYTLKSTANRLKELGVDPLDALGAKKEETDDDRPLTRKDLKEILPTIGQKTAEQLADEITDSYSRELVKHHLENTIKPSGNAQEDFRNALLLVNGVKNKQLIEQAELKGQTKTFASSSGAPAKETKVVELTQEEKRLKEWAGLTDEEILKARGQ